MIVLALRVLQAVGLVDEVRYVQPSALQIFAISPAPSHTESGTLWVLLATLAMKGVLTVEKPLSPGCLVTFSR